jgi:hypothetical protein
MLLLQLLLLLLVLLLLLLLLDISHFRRMAAIVNREHED